MVVVVAWLWCVWCVGGGFGLLVSSGSDLEAGGPLQNEQPPHLFHLYDDKVYKQEEYHAKELSKINNRLP